MALVPTRCRIRHARYLWVALMTCNDAFSLGVLHDAIRCSPLSTTPTARRANVRRPRALGDDRGAWHPHGQVRQCENGATIGVVRQSWRPACPAPRQRAPITLRTVEQEAAMVDRRAFLVGGVLAGAGLAGCTDDSANRRGGDSAGPTGDHGNGPATSPATATDLQDWAQVRGLFDLDPRIRHFAAFTLAAHPRPVREAIEAHRRGLDVDTHGYLAANQAARERVVREAAAGHLGAGVDEVALTDSTTMGLGLLYGGLRLRPGQEVVTTEHDFYPTHEALRLRAERDGASVRRVRLYADPATASQDEIVAAARAAVGPRTRLLAVTWVHSSTGVKLPIRAIADALAEANRGRGEGDRVLLAVDGVHGFGIEDATVDGLGCDFLAAGCHKWLFGPRGTGILYARRGAWPATGPTIPAFENAAFAAWFQDRPPSLPFGLAMTPGGYHSFEHRWALSEAFALHGVIGRRRVAERTHELRARLVDGLAGLRHVRLRTPRDARLAAGIVCFEVAGRPPGRAVAELAAAKVSATVTPYATSYVRLGPSIVTSPEDVDAAVRSVAALA
jgi:selenocysteine lyase/cysteine desulfurase